MHLAYTLTDNSDEAKYEAKFRHFSDDNESPGLLAAEAAPAAS